MKKKLILVALLGTSIVACNNFKKGDAGTEYKIVDHKGSGPLIKEGDIISLEGIIKTEKDSVLSSTYETGSPANLMVQKPAYKGDLMWAFTQLSEGDSAVVKINADSAMKYSGQPKPPGMTNKFFIYTLRIKKHFTKTAGEADSTFQGRVSSYFKGLTEKSKAEEPARIKKYIADKNLKVITTASGLNYVITKQGTGPAAVAGDTAIVNYTGSFFNGKVFDTSNEEAAKKAKTYQAGRPYAPIPVAVGVHQVIAGWDEALLLLPKGTKATLVIPSVLAYGETGMQGSIAPFTPLAFEIEVLDVKKAVTK
jgi:FKBP-type peptidyl-prolyl cis-trans isomerase FkpA